MPSIQLLLCLSVILHLFCIESQAKHTKRRKSGLVSAGPFITEEEIRQLAAKYKDFSKSKLAQKKKKKRKRVFPKRDSICECSEPRITTRKSSKSDFDTKIAEKLRIAKFAQVGKMWEHSGRFEGDILLGKLDNGTAKTNEKMKKNILSWPYGIIPYHFDSESFTPEQENTIIDVLNEFNKKTCVQFRPASIKDKEYIKIIGYRSGCFSHIGRRAKDINILNLQPPWCLDKSTILHVFMHALGLTHEHTTPQRTKFVNIKLNNVNNEDRRKFDVQVKQHKMKFYLGYDFNSIMHCSSTAFSKNNKPTIVPKNKHMKINIVNDLSDMDIAKIETIYEDECSIENEEEGKGLATFKISRGKPIIHYKNSKKLVM